MAHKILSSIRGKQLGISAAKGVIDPNGAVLDAAKINSAITAAAETAAHGFTAVQIASTAPSILLAAPTEGARAEVYINSTSSSVTMDAASADFTIGTSSTAISWTGAAGSLDNQYVHLRGVSSTWWALISASTLAVLA